MKTIALFVAAIPALLAGGCGGDGSTGKYLGTWKGSTPGVGLTIDITNEVDEAGKTSLQGTVSSAKMLCLTNGPLFGTVVQNMVTLSSHGAGTRSRLTLVEIAGQIMDGKINGTLTMTGDTSNEEVCEFDKVPIVFQR